MAFHKRWLSRSVSSDDGYEVALVGSVPRGRKLRYREAGKSVTCIGEQALITDDARRRWGLHFAIDERHLTHWDDGLEISATERPRIQARIGAALRFMKVPHTLETK